MRFMQFHWLVTWWKTTGHRFMQFHWLVTWWKTTTRLRFMQFSGLVSGGTLVFAVLGAPGVIAGKFTVSVCENSSPRLDV